jgi:hypothetical protein
MSSNYTHPNVTPSQLATVGSVTDWSNRGTTDSAYAASVVRGSTPIPVPAKVVNQSTMTQDGTVQNPIGTVQVNPETRPAPASNVNPGMTTGAGVVGTSSIGILLILAGGLWWLLSR